MSMLSRGVVDFKHFENVKSLFENVSLYIGLIAYTAAGAKVRPKAERLEILNSCNVAPRVFSIALVGIFWMCWSCVHFDYF